MPTLAQPSYQLLVANFSRPTQSLIMGSDAANMAATKVRTGFVFTHVQKQGGAVDHTQATYCPARSCIVETINALFDPFPSNVPPTGTVEVVSNVFENTSASLFIGPYQLVSGRDYDIGGGAAATATNIAQAIDALPEYSASAAGSSVTVSGPLGQADLSFFASYRGGEKNFSFTYTNDILELGFDPLEDSPIMPPIELPPGLPNGVPPV